MFALFMLDWKETFGNIFAKGTYIIVCFCHSLMLRLNWTLSLCFSFHISHTWPFIHKPHSVMKPNVCPVYVYKLLNQLIGIRNLDIFSQKVCTELFAFAILYCWDWIGTDLYFVFSSTIVPLKHSSVTSRIPSWIPMFTQFTDLSW